MNIYYVYAYLRENGTPYYIGKGKGNRAWDPQHCVKIPPNNRIIILESNLTEIGALALERRMIRWYGRKDIQSGILRNRTDGGDGVSGYKHSEETKQIIGNASRGKVNSLETRRKMSKPKSKETVEKFRSRKPTTEQISKFQDSWRKKRESGYESPCKGKTGTSKGVKLGPRKIPKFWINNGLIETKIDVGTLIPENYFKGRLK